jgi:hypothetical protein
MKKLFIVFTTIVTLLILVQVSLDLIRGRVEPFDTVHLSAFDHIVVPHKATKSEKQEATLRSQGKVKEAYELRADNVRKTLRKCVKLFDDYKITDYWMDSGVLLGIYNIGDVLPYDGDADVGISSKYVETLRSIPDDVLRSKYGLTIDRRTVKPLLFALEDPDTNVYCDLFVFDVTDDHIETDGYVWVCKGCKDKNRFKMDKDVVYPIQQYDLDGTIVNIPNKPKKYLKYLYGKKLDPNFKWDEERNDYVHARTVRDIVYDWCDDNIKSVIFA